MKVSSHIQWGEYTQSKKELKEFIQEHPKKQAKFLLSFKDLKNQKFESLWQSSFYETQKEKKVSNTIEQFSLQNAQLIEQLGLKTTFEKFILFIVMKSKSYLEVSEKLKRIAKNKAQKEIIIRVIIAVFLQEQTYNQYYCFLFRELCLQIHDLKFMIYHFYWKRFLRMEQAGASDREIELLCKLCVELMEKQCFEFKILKNFDFTSLNPTQTGFLEVLISLLFTSLPEKFISQQLDKMNLNRKNASLLQDIQYFLEQKGKQMLQSQTSPRNRNELHKKILLVQDLSINI